MRQSGHSVLSNLDQSLDRALQASTSEDLLQALGDCVQMLVDAFSTNERERARIELETAFAACSTDIRRRRLLEFCLAPVFDKPPLPCAEGAEGEFLWLFAIPFVVTFRPEALKTPILFRDEAVDAGAILSELQETGYMNREGALRASVRLFKREDLQVLGPPKLAGLFVHAELHKDDILEPLPLMFDPEMDAYRSVTLFLLAASRLPLGEHRLFQPAVPWPADTMGRVVQASLAAQGLAVESVESLPPQSIPEMLMRFSGAGARELRANLLNAKNEYAGVEVIVRTAVEGYAEVNGRLPDGTEIVLVPAFSYFESVKELGYFVRQTCEEFGMPFLGVFGLNVPQPATLH